jgi:Uma2 family endonuclease
MAFATRAGSRVTTEEFLAGPEQPGVLLLDGEVFVNDATHRHQRLCSRIFAALLDWTRSPGGSGEVGWGGNWVLGPATVVKPDVWWMAGGPGDGPRFDGTPDLAVEVLSPGTRRLDLGRKRDLYRDAGLPELWLVDSPSSSVVAVRFSERDDAEFGPGDTIASPSLPGFALAVDELFAS